MSRIIKWASLTGICALMFSASFAVDIAICEDDEGNQSFHKSCPPGTFLVEEKKVSVGGNSSSYKFDLSKLNVVLYTIPVCETCEEVKIYLKSRDIPFAEKDVSKDLELQKELTEISGKLSVPVTVIGDEFVSGYDRVRIGNIIDSLVPPEE